MNPDAVMAVLPDNKEKAKSLKEIAHAMGLDTSSHTDWIRTQRTLARVLRTLIKWGLVACGQRQSDNGKKFWHNAYWKTELARQEEGSLDILDGVMVPTKQEQT
jgi:hypothetical protein